MAAKLQLSWEHSARSFLHIRGSPRIFARGSCSWHRLWKEVWSPNLGAQARLWELRAETVDSWCWFDHVCKNLYWGSFWTPSNSKLLYLSFMATRHISKRQHYDFWHFWGTTWYTWTNRCGLHLWFHYIIVHSEWIFCIWSSQLVGCSFLHCKEMILWYGAWRVEAEIIWNSLFVEFSPSCLPRLAER